MALEKLEKQTPIANGQDRKGQPSRRWGVWGRGSPQGAEQQAHTQKEQAREQAREMSMQVPALPCPFQRMNLGFVSSASLRHRLMVSRPSPNDHDPGSPPYPAKDEMTVTSGLHDVMLGGATSMGQTVQCPVHLPHLAAALAPGNFSSEEGVHDSIRDTTAAVHCSSRGPGSCRRAVCVGLHWPLCHGLSRLWRLCAHLGVSGPKIHPILGHWQLTGLQIPHFPRIRFLPGHRSPVRPVHVILKMETGLGALLGGGGGGFANLRHRFGSCLLVCPFILFPLLLRPRSSTTTPQIPFHSCPRPSPAKTTKEAFRRLVPLLGSFFSYKPSSRHTSR